MGQPVTLITTTSPRPGILRFELNRSLTGMGHVRYEMGDEIRKADVFPFPQGRQNRNGYVAVGISIDCIQHLFSFVDFQ